jgi:hypothetical protein
MRARDQGEACGQEKSREEGAAEGEAWIPPSPVFCGKRLEVLENREDSFLRRAENCKKVQKNAKAREIATSNEWRERATRAVGRWTCLVQMFCRKSTDGTEKKRLSGNAAG